MSELEIQLFGGLHVVHHGQPVTALCAPRQQALLAWLLLHAGAPQPRKQIAFALWPDSDEPQALTNLRRELHHLRRGLPECERYLEVSAQTLCWRQDAPCTLDVQEFEEALGKLGRQTPPSTAELARAADLYTGELLYAADDEWLEPERQRLHRRAVEVLEVLAAQLEQSGERTRALTVLERLLALEPLRESAYAAMMRLHLAGGDAAAARQVYRRCVNVLKAELDVLPGQAVQAAYEFMQRGAAATPPTPPGELPLIGRRREWPGLLRVWQQTCAGSTRVLLIAGEAGIGKTRLAEALLALALSQGASTARSRSYAAEGRLAYAPISDWLRSPALTAGVGQLGEPWKGELARLLPELAPSAPAAPELPSQGWQRQRLFEALARAFLAGGGPILLLDDLQWCDRDTLEWLHFLLRFAPTTPLLLLCTLRPEALAANPALRTFLQDMQQRGGLERMDLGPLTAQESGELAASLHPAELSAGAQAQLFQATEGQPLFIVEAVRAGLTVNADDGLLALPASPRVQAIIAARLEQLSPEARSAAQLAATIGRAFEVEVLRDASDLEEVALVAALDELWHGAIIREQPGGGVYDFTHDRLREGAYDAISPARRRLLHRRVAQALELRHAPDLGRVAAPLAAHHEQAGQLEKAVTFYLRAAGRANTVSASQQAIEQARQALRLVGQLPASAGRDQHELEARISLAAAFNALRGFASPELETHLNRALHIGEKLGDEQAIISSLWGLYALQIVRGNVPLSRHLAERALGLAGEDSGLLTDCHQALGGVDMIEGQLVSAAEHFGIANRLYHRIGHRRVLFGADVGAFSLSWGAHGLWLQGRVKEAREHVARATVIAAELDHPFTGMQTAAYRAISHQLERNVKAAWDSAESAVSGCQEHQIAYYHEWGVVVGGWAQAMRGEGIAGLERIQRGLEALHQQNATLRLPYYLALLAEVHLLLDQPEAARATLDSAQVVASQNGDVWYLPELHRLHGQTEPARAEDCFRRALSVARGQGSLSLELRAATSLARHLHGMDRTAGALSLLEPVESAFPASLVTPDLNTARTLLHTLS
ncbi:AAA family ATPase [Deinococcus frigens]|uniref:AAA family ATPase n=1 Tax=Deinococcus frigens TaxID=249403 RepID=UPI000494F39C|nr:AAA family ATPase [Deinococcus frigens]